VLIEDRLTFTLTYNKGGAFGLFSDEADIWRKPFFFIVSLVAVFFIVALYRRVSPEQKTLKWGLPLVLAGALGNVADRITKGKVVDFIDYRADWVQSMNELIQAVNSNWYVSRHWPTFNVADICICVGVGLMALEMFFGSRGEATEAPNPPAGSGSPAS
jgi:signal peptidase II